jgi:hypothetical protein
MQRATVEKLEARKNRQADMDATNTLIAVGIYGGIFGYPILQLLALIRLRGWWRALAAIPLTVMVPVLLITFRACYHQSNLWPLPLIFIAPPVLVYLIVLLCVEARVSNRQKPQ